MHVALNGWFWDRPDTGSGQYTRELLFALCKQAPDLQITLIYPAQFTITEALPKQVRRVPVAMRWQGQLGKVWFEQIAFPRTAANASADLAHYPYWAAPLRSPIPVVTTIHDVIPLALPVYQGGLLARLYTSLVTAGARGAAHIITDSDASRQEIVERLRIPAPGISVIWLAAGESFHPREDPAHDAHVKAKYGLPDRFVMYLGGFDIRKNVHTLLLAWTYVAQAMDEDVPLILAGRPPRTWGTDRFPNLPGYAEQLRLTPYIRWLGEIDEADKASLYRLAEVMVFPSRYEGFGLPPLEAMACGTPVVACETSSIPEIVGDAAFLVEPDNARDMAGAILGLLLQPPLAAQMRNLGLARASKFKWEFTAEQTLAVYRQIVADSSRSGHQSSL